MKKALVISLLVLLTLGLFVACNANAVEAILSNEIEVSIYDEDNVVVGKFTVSGKTWADCKGQTVKFIYKNNAEALLVLDEYESSVVLFFPDEGGIGPFYTDISRTQTVKFSDKISNKLFISGHDS